MLLSKEVSYEKMFSLVLALSLLLSLSTTGYAAVNDDCNNITIDVFEEHFYYDGDCRTENCIRLQKSFPNFLHSSHALRCVAAYFFVKGADANEISFG